ncbi:MAG: type-II NADH dehydrogenase [Monoraphidium minutum]|nr:MAG: type-II NADH dehydrogenase [Monoraphidium minutum]
MAGPAAPAPRARVLVIGAGFAGAALAIELTSKGLDATLVDCKDYMEVVFANARTLVEPAVADQAIIPIEELKPHGKFVRGYVTELHPRRALLADGTALEFDYAAVCSGSSQAFGKGAAASVAERKAELKAQHEALAAAAAVVVVGGGSLGVELAGEILTDMPGKEVVLVHSGDRLMPALPPRASRLAMSWLQSKNCKVILNDRLAGAPPSPAAPAPAAGPLATASGRPLPAGALVLWATGTRPATGLMKAALAETLDAAGRIKVGPTLQVVGHPRLFALGDAADVPEEKLAYLAQLHAPVAASNIASLAAAEAAAAAEAGAGGDAAAAAAAGGKQQQPTLSVWQPGRGMPMVMIVSLGRDYCIGHFGCFTFGAWLLSKVKDMGMFIARTRRALCAPQPAAAAAATPQLA